MSFTAHVIGVCVVSLIIMVRTVFGGAVQMHICDSTGNLGVVNVQSGEASLIGNMGVTMTDIAWDPNGNLFGISFASLYSINPLTAEATLIGAHGVSGLNALVFGFDGTLYAAANSSTQLYAINANNAASTAIGNIGFASSGDLAFNAGQLYMSSTTNELIRIDLGDEVSGTSIGPIGFPNVYGLATGDDGVLYGVTGTSTITIDPMTGLGSFLSSYEGQGLASAFGSSFFGESIPAPGAFILLGGSIFFGRRRRR